jgi:hypothetical protein
MTALDASPRVPVSWGELVDKKTILEIKVERLRAPEAVANARRELEPLAAILATVVPQPTGLDRLEAELRSVNVQLWDIEDAIRRKEAQQSFDTGFIELARSVYRSNDERARLKREINLLLRSDLVEEKQYDPY